MHMIYLRSRFACQTIYLVPNLVLKHKYTKRSITPLSSVKEKHIFALCIGKHNSFCPNKNIPNVQSTHWYVCEKSLCFCFYLSGICCTMCWFNDLTEWSVFIFYLIRESIKITDKTICTWADCNLCISFGFVCLI